MDFIFSNLHHLFSKMYAVWMINIKKEFKKKYDSIAFFNWKKASVDFKAMLKN